MSNLLIFLGAGASAEFGIPTIRRLTRQFAKKYAHHAPKIESLKRNLSRIGFPLNIENILSYARGLAHPKKALLDSSPFIAHLVTSGSVKRLGYDPGAKAIIGDIQEFIAEKCLVTDSIRIEKIQSFYSRFFKRLGRYIEDPVFDIFTTNYDNTIEQYAISEGINIFYGYEPTADRSLRFAPELYEIPNPIRLHKLHGSVTLGLAENKTSGETKVIESPMGHRIGDAYDGAWRVVDRVMIYGYEKDPTHEPYFDLLYLLKEKMRTADNILVVGYSFSDRPILNVFKDVLDSRSEMFKITILDRSASHIKRQRLVNDKRIRVINSRFCNFHKRIRGYHFA